MTIPSTVGGFKVLSVQYPSSTQHIYAREHVEKATGKTLLPSGRTLFLVNIPPDATERELSALFKTSGTVERIIFDLETHEYNQEDSDSEEEEEAMEEDGGEAQPRKKRKLAKDDAPQVISLPSTSTRILRESGRTAHIVFLDSSSLERALSSTSKPRPWPSIEEEPSGLAHYLELYNSQRPPLDLVWEHADSSIALYEYEQQRAKQKSKYRKGEAIVDDDGFTLVTRGGAYGKTLGGGVGVATKKFQRSGQASKRNRKPKQEKQTPGLYAFQKAEQQRKRKFTSSLKF